MNEKTVDEIQADAGADPTLAPPPSACEPMPKQAEPNVREIRTHRFGACNSALCIFAIDEPGHDGANHAYIIRCGSVNHTILFQNGPVKDVGNNGVTVESLLAVVRDHLEGFQRGKYAHPMNERAIDHIKTAMLLLAFRTQERIARGVDGTMEV